MLRTIQQYRCSFCYLVPTIMKRVWDLPHATREAFDVSSLRGAFHMAAPCPPWLKEAWCHWLGPHKVYELYGATEAMGYTVIRVRPCTGSHSLLVWSWPSISTLTRILRRGTNGSLSQSRKASTASAALLRATSRLLTLRHASRCRQARWARCGCATTSSVSRTRTVAPCQRCVKRFGRHIAALAILVVCSGLLNSELITPPHSRRGSPTRTDGKLVAIWDWLTSRATATWETASRTWCSWVVQTSTPPRCDASSHHRLTLPLHRTNAIVLSHIETLLRALYR